MSEGPLERRLINNLAELGRVQRVARAVAAISSAHEARKSTEIFEEEVALRRRLLPGMSKEETEETVKRVLDERVRLAELHLDSLLGIAVKPNSSDA